MKEGEPVSERYRVGDLVVDVGDATVARGGERIHLPRRTFELLVLLVRRAPHLVRRADILDSIWPDEHVTDQTVTHRVLLLRHALGDHAEHPRYIAGERGWGYRLVEPAERIASSEPVVPRARGRSRLVPAASLAVLLGLLIGQSGGSLVSPVKRPSVAVRPLSTSGPSGPLIPLAGDLAAALDARLHGLDGVRVVRWEEHPDAWFEGRVGAKGEELEVDLRLVDSRSGQAAWSRTLRGPVYDVIPAQTRLLEEAARALGERLGLAPPAEAAVEPVSRRVQRLCLRGEFYWLSWCRKGMDGARESFLAALVLAPAHAPALAGLSMTESVSALLGYRPAGEARLRARLHARRALEEAPRLPSSQLAGALVRLVFDGDPVSARNELRQTVSRAPDLLCPRFGLALAQQALGRYEESLSVLVVPTYLEPASGLLLLRGRALQASGRPQDAATTYERALVANPELHAARVRLAECRAALGREREAVEALALEPSPSSLAAAWRRACRSESLPPPARARACLHAGDARAALLVLRTRVGSDWPTVLLARRDAVLGAVADDPS
jgi:DNA-binding winged helix-turn-helix (wHTH) protein/tetratricopeptide (TPR) repeat protein